MNGLGLHGVQKWLGLIGVLESFSYKDLLKILAKFGFMMVGYKDELERDYCVSILVKDSIFNMETKGQQHVGLNSPIYLYITSNDSFPYEENKRRPDLEDFPYFFSFLLHGFLTLKGDCGRLLKWKNSATLFPIFRALIQPNNERRSSIQVSCSKHEKISKRVGKHTLFLYKSYPTTQGN
jgi:hypothetical protein